MWKTRAAVADCEFLLASCENIKPGAIIINMASSGQETKKPGGKKGPPALWKSVILIILFTFVIMVLFGFILFLLIRGAQQMGLSTAGYIAILVIISGVFAWLIKRLSDAVSGLSAYWFSEESEERD